MLSIVSARRLDQAHVAVCVGQRQCGRRSCFAWRVAMQLESSQYPFQTVLNNSVHAACLWIDCGSNHGLHGIELVNGSMGCPTNQACWRHTYSNYEWECQCSQALHVCQGQLTARSAWEPCCGFPQQRNRYKICTSFHVTKPLTQLQQILAKPRCFIVDRTTFMSRYTH